MPSLKDIRRRITSVQKTQQITRAMRMVAGAKLRRAQDAIERARPYADRMQRTLQELARGGAEHPLLRSRDEVRRFELLLVTSDRGLCGAFNTNVIKRAEALVAQREPGLESVALATAGRKGNEYFRRRRAEQIAHHHPLEGWVVYGDAAALARRAIARFESGEVDEVVLVYSEFANVMSQRPLAVPLLPFRPEGGADAGSEAPSYEIEPSPEKLLATLVPKAVEVALFRALLESQAGEHAARMTAMESATRNTEELIESLTLDFNRARQAAITKELVEIVSGAEAL